MKISRDPVVWRAAIAAVVAAAVNLGLLTAAQGDTVNGWVAPVVGAVSLLLPIIAGLLARARTVPVKAGTPSVRLLTRGHDGVYRPAAEQPSHVTKVSGARDDRGGTIT